MTVRLFAVHGIPLERPEGDERKWQMVLPKGKRFHRIYGEMDFTTPVLSAMVANFRKLAARYKGKDAFGVQINYHHLGGIELAANAPLENTVAAGWVEDLDVRDDGLWGLVRWTPRAREHILADEFRYLSSECAPDWLDEVTGQKQGHTFFGVALTNTPVLKDMPRVAAHDAITEAAPAADQGATRMDKKLLCARLGLAETATEEEINAKLDALKLAEAASKDGAVKLSESATKLSDVQALATRLADELKAAKERATKLETENQEREVALFAEGLVKAGKVTPAMVPDVKALASKDMPLAVKLFGSATAIRMGEMGHGDAPAPTGSETPDEANKKIDAEAQKLAKEQGLKLSEARLRAIAANPELARKAQPRSTNAQ